MAAPADADSVDCDARVVKRSGLIALLLAAAIAGCGSSDPEVVVATLPATPVPYPEIRARTSDDATPRRQFDARRLIGHDIKWAKRLASRFGCTIRVTEGDDAVDGITLDYRPDRIDVAVQRGVVTRID